MFNAPALDVAIGLTFLYLSLALMVTAANEWLAALLTLRGKTLTEGVGRLLDGDKPGPMTREFFRHPLVKSLSKGKRPPSYVPPRTFALVVKDMASRQQQHDMSDSGSEGLPAEASAKAGATGLPAEASAKAGAASASAAHLQKQFQTLALGLSPSDERSQAEILEEWFNDSMERASGWYKRQIQIVTVIVAAVLTILTNADTLRAAAILWANPTIRAAAVEQARVRAAMPLAEPPTIQAAYQNLNNPTPPTASRSSAEFVNPSTSPGTATEAESAATIDTSALSLFIGWSNTFRHFNDQYCAAKQRAVNASCGTSAPPNDACQAQIDDLAADARCELDGTRRVGRNVTPGWAIFGSPFIVLSLAAKHSVGWLLTIIAVSLGAPFWFDLLKRLVNVRGAGTKPTETAKKKAEA
jgi:hypothetical protein